jgi:hypothetical protein
MAASLAPRAAKVRDSVNREVYFALPVSYRRTPLKYSLRRGDSDFVVFCCFSKPEDAEVCAERFGGKRLPTGSRR